MWGAVPGWGLTRGMTGYDAFGLICRLWPGAVRAAAGPTGRVPIGALPLQGTVTVPGRPRRPGDGHPSRADQEPSDHDQDDAPSAVPPG
jgi:hypothetical protein